MNALARLVRSSHRSAAVIAIAAVAWSLLAIGPVRSQAPAADPQDVAEGMRIFRQKGDCQSCHGWAADGRKMDTQMPDGANLRTSRLNRAAVIYTIKCGRPGREMPAYDRLAYSDGRCNNTTKTDLQRNNLALPDPPSTLQPREIEMVADFLFAKVIGKGPMDHAKCVEYWGGDVDVCQDLAK